MKHDPVSVEGQACWEAAMLACAPSLDGLTLDVGSALDVAKAHGVQPLVAALLIAAFKDGLLGAASDIAKEGTQ